MQEIHTHNNDYHKELVIKSLTEKLLPSEHEELERWLRDSEEHRRYYMEIRRSWSRAVLTGEWEAYDAQQAWQELKPKLHGGSRFYRGGMGILWRAAALFILAFTLGITAMYIGLRGSEKVTAVPNRINEITAPLGSKSRVMLPDSTVVWLNAGSRLRYAQTYDGTSRDVELVGEGYFQVRTNPEKPFVVHAGEVKVRAFGTAFNVKAYPEEKTISTTLVEGKVDVEARRVGGGEPIRLTLKPRQNVVIIKGMEEKGSPVVVEEHAPEPGTSHEGESQSPVVVASEIKTTLYTSWKDENWIVERMNLDDFIVMVGRRFDVDFVYKSEDLKQYKISGTIRKETLEQVLDLLKLTTPLKYRIKEGVVTLDYDASRSGNYQQVMHEQKNI